MQIFEPKAFLWVSVSGHCFRWGGLKLCQCHQIDEATSISLFRKIRRQEITLFVGVFLDNYRRNVGKCNFFSIFRIIQGPPIICLARVFPYPVLGCFVKWQTLILNIAQFNYIPLQGQINLTRINSLDKLDFTEKISRALKKTRFTNIETKKVTPFHWHHGNKTTTELTNIIKDNS